MIFLLRKWSVTQGISKIYSLTREPNATASWMRTDQVLLSLSPIDLSRASDEINAYQVGGVANLLFLSFGCKSKQFCRRMLYLQFTHNCRGITCYYQFVQMVYHQLVHSCRTRIRLSIKLLAVMKPSVVSFQRKTHDAPKDSRTDHGMHRNLYKITYGHLLEPPGTLLQDVFMAFVLQTLSPVWLNALNWMKLACLKHHVNFECQFRNFPLIQPLACYLEGPSTSWWGEKVVCRLQCSWQRLHPNAYALLSAWLTIHTVVPPW